MKKMGLYGKIILATVLAIAVITGIVIFATPRDTTAYATMECSVNPDVQFVLNSQERVISYVCLNEDAEVLVSGTDFEGKTAEEAAYLFTKLATEAGYIDPETTGTTVEITINCPEDANLETVRARIRSTVNTYFENNGIIGCAMATISNDLQALKTMAQDLGVDSALLTNKTRAQIMAMIHENNQYYKEIAQTMKTNFKTAIQAIRTQYENMFTLKDTIETLQESIDNSELLTDEQKAALIADLEDAQASYNELRVQYEAAINALVAEYKEDSAALLEQARTQLETRLADGQTALNTHRQNFQQNKAQIQQQIENYRDSVENAD